MAKQIIVLGASSDGAAGSIVNVAFWLAVAPGKELPIANAVSAWSGASAPENAAIAAGSVIEEVCQTGWPAGVGKAKVQSELVQRFNARQAQITALSNFKQYGGIFFDSGTGWSA